MNIQYLHFHKIKQILKCFFFLGLGHVLKGDNNAVAKREKQSLSSQGFSNDKDLMHEIDDAVVDQLDIPVVETDAIDADELSMLLDGINKHRGEDS